MNDHSIKTNIKNEINNIEFPAIKTEYDEAIKSVK